MSSTQQLWAPAPQRATGTAERLNSRSDMLPGTWLQLSPDASAPTSPSLQAEAAVEFKDELTLRRGSDNERFLSNINSRSSSMSSQGSAPLARHPPLGSRFHVSPSVERREMAVGRAGGLAAVFGGN